MQCLNCLPQWDSCTDWFQFRVCRKLWSCQAGEDVPWDRGAPWRPGSTPSRWASSCTCLTCPCCWARSPRSWGQCGLLWKLHFLSIQRQMPFYLHSPVQKLLFTSQSPSGEMFQHSWWWRRSHCESSRTPPDHWCSTRSPTPSDQLPRLHCRPEHQSRLGGAMPTNNSPWFCPAWQWGTGPCLQQSPSPRARPASSARSRWSFPWASWLYVRWLLDTVIWITRDRGNFIKIQFRNYKIS